MEDYDKTSLEMINSELSGEVLSSFCQVWNYVQLVFQEKRLTIYSTFSINYEESIVPNEEITLGLIRQRLIGKKFIRLSYIPSAESLVEMETANITVDYARNIDRETFRYGDEENPSKIYVL